MPRSSEMARFGCCSAPRLSPALQFGWPDHPSLSEPTWPQRPRPSMPQAAASAASAAQTPSVVDQRHCASRSLRRRLRPERRYHVAGGKGVFYARAPYMNKDLGAGAHATRFIGLAPVGNAGKQKFLHALALVPAVDMNQKELTVRWAWHRRHSQGASPAARVAHL